MKANSLQTLIRLNAEMITDMHIDVAFFKDQIRYFDSIGRDAKAQGNIEVYNAAQLEEYAYVNALRSVQPQLTKAVTIQKEMKAELSFIRRMDRIERALDKLAEKNIVLIVQNDLTSHQLESIVNAKMLEVFPPKADSRANKVA